MRKLRYPKKKAKKRLHRRKYSTLRLWTTTVETARLVRNNLGLSINEIFEQVIQEMAAKRGLRVVEEWQVSDEDYQPFVPKQIMDAANKSKAARLKREKEAAEAVKPHWKTKMKWVDRKTLKRLKAQPHLVIK